MGAEPAVDTEPAAVPLEDLVHHLGVEVAPSQIAGASEHRPEQGTIGVVFDASADDVLADPVSGLGVQSDDVFVPALPPEPEHVVPPVLEQVAHHETSDARPARAGLEPHGQKCPVAQAHHRVQRRCVENLTGLMWREGGRRPSATIRSRSGDLPARVHHEHVVVDEVREQGGEGGELPSDRRGTHAEPLELTQPRQDGGSVDGAQLVSALDPEERHETDDVHPVGPTRGGGAVSLEPDLLLRHGLERREHGDGRQLAGDWSTEPSRYEGVLPLGCLIGTHAARMPQMEDRGGPKS